MNKLPRWVWHALAALAVPGAAAESAAAPTFNRDIAPLVFRNCAACHRPGEVAPFPLLTYGDVKKRAAQIVEVTASRFMPPWKGVPGHGEFLDERRLSDEQIELLAGWVRAGTPEGDPADLPALPQFKPGWQLGTPDLVLTLPEAYHVPAEGVDIYHNFVLSAPQLEGRHIKAVEFRPGNRRVVHHAALASDISGGARKSDAEDPGLGFTRFNIPGQLLPGSLAIWTPGRDPVPLPDGFSMPWPAGADFILQLHLHPSGKPETELSSIGIHFTDEKPTRSMLDVILIDKKIDIAPGERAFRTRDELVLPADVRVYGIFPHMHLLGKDIKVTAVAPDGSSTPLLWINDWDFNWQNIYQYANPLLLTKGTRVRMECVHDNSAENPRNPSPPPQRVGWGEQTTDEMSLAILQFVPERESDLASFQVIRPRILGGIIAEGSKLALGTKPAGDGKPSLESSLFRAKQAVTLLDRDKDQKLSLDEMVGVRGATREQVAQRIAEFDRDKDEKLNVDELAAAIQKLPQ